MADRAQLEEAERLASQLPFPERLKLVARICERLSLETAGIDDPSSAAGRRLAELDSWLAECDSLRRRVQAGFDAVEEIRQLHEDRAVADERTLR
jgi:hypothetical protein